MPIPFILGALASLAVGGGLGALQRQQQQATAERETMQKILLDSVMKGTALPTEAVNKYFSKDMGPALNMLAESNRIRQQDELSAAQRFMADEPAQSTSGVNGVPMPQPGPQAPGDPFAASLVARSGAAQPPQAPMAVPETEAPTTTVPPLPSVRDSKSASVKLGNTTLSRQQGAVTPMDVESMRQGRERLGLEQGRFGIEQGRFGLEQERLGIDKSREARETEARAEASVKSVREQVLFTQEQDARQRIQSLMEQSAAEGDPAKKLQLQEQALAVATGGGLKEIVSTLGSHITKQRELTTGKQVNLADPETARYIATTGNNPMTNQPVDPKTRRDAGAAVAARETALKDRAATIAGNLAAIQSTELPKRAAMTGSIKTLVKEGDNIAKVKNTADRIQAALKSIEENMDAFPSTAVLGTLVAQAARFMQTERGRKIAKIQQNITLLQSIEARQLAGEQGRIANQIEQQWRDVQADPTKVTGKMARDLITNSRRLTADLLRTNAATVQKNAAAARGVGVPPQIVEAFTKGDLDVLKSTLGEGLGNGALPAVIGVEDLK